MKCPLCGKPNDADWPLRMPDGSIQVGGCQMCWEEQMCWEKQCSEAWWEMVEWLGESPKSTPAVAGVRGDARC